MITQLKRSRYSRLNIKSSELCITLVAIVITLISQNVMPDAFAWTNHVFCESHDLNLLMSCAFPFSDSFIEWMG